MSSWGTDFQAIVDKLQLLAVSVAPTGVTVKGSSVGTEGSTPGGMPDFPYVVIRSAKSPVDKISINEDRFRLYFDVLYVTTNDDIYQGFKDLVKLGGKFYDDLQTNAKLNNTCAWAYAVEWDAGFAPTEKHFTRLYLKVRVMVIAHR